MQVSMSDDVVQGEMNRSLAQIAFSQYNTKSQLSHFESEGPKRKKLHVEHGEEELAEGCLEEVGKGITHRVYSPKIRSV